MIRVNVQADVSGLMAQFEQIKDPSVAVSRAINKTLTTCRARAARAVKAAGYKIKASEIKANLKTNRRATKSLLVGYVDAKGKPIPLIKYGARGDRRPGGGVSVDVLHGRKLITGAFIATMPAGHKGVFVRVGSSAHSSLRLTGKHSGIKRGKTSYKHGLPIQELFGPSVTAAFKNADVQGAMARTARDRFPVVLKQELTFLSLKQAS